MRITFLSYKKAMRIDSAILDESDNYGKKSNVDGSLK